MARKKSKSSGKKGGLKKPGAKRLKGKPEPQAESANLFATGVRGAGFPKFGPKYQGFIEAAVEILKSKPLVRDKEVFEELAAKFDGFKATRPRWMSYARHLVRTGTAKPGGEKA